MRSAFFFLFFLAPAVRVMACGADSASEKNVASTHTWNLPSGDSILIFESRILYYSDQHPNAQGNALMNVLFPGRSLRSYSQTSKYVVKKKGEQYTITWYLSDRDRSPNYKFDRVMKKQKYWHFKKYREVELSTEEVKKLCLFERLCTLNGLNKFDEGDISKSMTVIRQGGKEVCSSYRDALVVEEIISKK
jgi:hypothetical protein